MLEELRERLLERNAAARMHYQNGNMDRRETALEESYELEEQIIEYVIGRGFSPREAETALNIMSCGRSADDALQAVIDEDRDRDEQQMYASLAYGF